MNLGLRYEYQTPFYERFGDLAVFDPVNARFLKLDEDIENLHAPDQKQLCATHRDRLFHTPQDGDSGGWRCVLRTASRIGVLLFQFSPPFVIDSTLTSNPLVPDLVGRLFPRPQVRDAAGRILLSPNTNVFSIDPNFRDELHVSMELRHPV